MIDVIQAGIRDQFAAALMMLRNSIEHCEPGNWTGLVGRFPFWQVAYHTLFYTDLYLCPGEAAFAPPPCHQQGYQWFGENPSTKQPVTVGEPLKQAVLLEYADRVMTKMNRTIMDASESELRGESGFSWLPFPRVQAHLYNLRHLQHHAGQLSAFLNREQGKATPWVRAHCPS